jgi:RNA polymerase sigma factor (sigma-70 family)
MASQALTAGWVHPAPLGALGSDERLARRVAGGDEKAFSAIYGRYHQRLYRYCVSILRDETDAQDALQSTFERALCALRREQRDAPLRPWLFRIAHNEAITLMRRRKRAPGPVPDRAHPAVAQSAEHEAGERDRLATLVADLAELPQRPRSALIMRELEGLSHDDIAIALDTTVGAAKQAIFEARRGLAEMADGREMNCQLIRRQLSDGDGRVLRGRRVRAHLRACRACAEYASAIPARRADLRALAPPLAPAAAGSIFARILLGHGLRKGLSAATAGVGKGGLAGAISSKLALSAAVLATATAGTAGVAVIEPLVVGHAVPSHGTPAPRVRSPAAARAAVRSVSTAPLGSGSARERALSPGHDSGFGSASAMMHAGAPAAGAVSSRSVGRAVGQRGAVGQRPAAEQRGAIGPRGRSVGHSGQTVGHRGRSVGRRSQATSKGSSTSHARASGRAVHGSSQAHVQPSKAVPKTVHLPPGQAVGKLRHQ